MLPVFVGESSPDCRPGFVCFCFVFCLLVCYFGMRLYTDDSHDFTEFLHEAQCERKPLSSLEITKQADGAAYVGYDALRGAYRFDVSGGDFNNNYYNKPFQYFKVNAQIQSDELSRDVYVYTHTF